MNYKEPVGTGNTYRLNYLNSIRELTAGRLRNKREESLQNASRFLTDSSGQRRRFIEMLGWPLTEYQYAVPAVQKDFVAKDGEISIYRLMVEALPGLSYYGILFVREDGKKRPLILSQHGGDGTPELCSSLEPDGTSNYNEMTRRILKYDVNAFAGQMLLWNTQKYDLGCGTDNLCRCECDAVLKQCGGSMTALEVYCLMKSLDYLCICDFTDPQRIGMVGLSYGGFYTLFASAADVRIKAALSCSFFNERDIYCWRDWTWLSAGMLMHDAEIAMLTYPRKLYLAVGDKDTLFSADNAIREEQRLRRLSDSAYGGHEWYEFCVFNGEHEFIRDEYFLEKMIKDIWR